MNNRFNYDIIVIGAGPAGSMAAKSAVSRKPRLKVCLLERKERTGTPVRCGEAIGLKGAIHNNFHIEKSWIKASIQKFRFVSPNGTKVDLSKGIEGYVLDREKMDFELARQAVSEGCDYYRKTPVISISQLNEKFYECKSLSNSFVAPCVILAEGIESRLARNLGWNTALSPDDVDCCAFCHISHDAIKDDDTCIFYTGSVITPAGYGWVFPRGKNEANIGVGVLGSLSTAGKAKELLSAFVDKHYPGASMSDIHCGGAPAGRWLTPLVKDGVMIVGDAARQIISLSGAGINYSIFAGELAGRIAAESITDGSVDHANLKKYETIWASDLGKQQLRSYALKNLLVKHCDDNFLNKIAKSLSKKQTDKLSVLGVFLKTFISNPIAFIKAFLLFK